MDKAKQKMIENDHKRFVGENLRLAREAVNQKPSAWTKKYPTFLTTQSKLDNYESGRHYPPPLFLKRLCDDYGFTMDWFYRRVAAGASALVVDGLRQAAEGKQAASQG